MEHIARSIFITRLIFTIVLDTCGIFLENLLAYKGSLAFLFFIFFVVITTLLSSLIQKERFKKQQIYIQNKNEENKKIASDYITYWESITELQPTKQGLLNIVKLYEYIGKKEKAQEYKNKAFLLDPNGE